VATPNRRVVQSRVISLEIMVIELGYATVELIRNDLEKVTRHIFG
jgi:hypothetical protein